ncbi:MFS transporter [Nonomuraea sp. 10N515B]|uniref:MFS transporter n=1 Tax=Nonomuraea sp. 10N515B TaxID=3457422 RepID=UPI003FCE1F73
MVIQAQSAPPQVDTRRVGAAVAAAGLSSFALLYAPQPVLPQLAAAFRLDPGSASLAIGVATGALAVAVLPVAALAETVGRRRMIVWSVVVSAVLGLLLPLAPSFPVLLVMRAVQGVAIAGFAGVAAAYLADQVGIGRLAAAVGTMIAGNSVGGMLGRLGTGFAAGPLGWHGALAVVAVVALACALFASLTLPRTPSPLPAPSPAHDPTSARNPASSGEPADTTAHAVRSPPLQTHAERPPLGVARLGLSRAGSGSGGVGRAGRTLGGVGRAGRTLGGVGRAGRRNAAAGVLVPCVVGALATGAFVALYNAAGFRLAAPPLSLAPATASLVFLSYAMGTASSAAAGRLTARLGRTAALVTSLLVTIAGAALTLHASLPVVTLGFAGLTAGFFAAHAIANAWVTAQATPRARGRAAGLYTLCYYLGSGAGGTAGTVVFGHAGWPWLIALTSAWLLLAALAVLLARSPAAVLSR